MGAAEPTKTRPASDTLAGLLADRQRTRQRVIKLRERVAQSWGQLRQILGDGLDEIEQASDPETELDKLESAMEQIHQGFNAASAQLVQARQQYVSVDTTFRVESVKRRQRRVARFGLLILLVALVAASALRIMTAG